MLALFALLATAGLVIGLAAAVKPEAFKASGSKVSPVLCGGCGEGCARPVGRHQN